MPSIHFRPDRRGLDRLLRSQSGDVGRFMRRKQREVEYYARRRVGVDTGRLLASIRSYPTHGPTGPSFVVVATAPYAVYHHEGTRPHRIDSPVYIRGVGWRYIGMHPGTKPNPFLLEAIRDAGLRPERTR